MAPLTAVQRQVLVPRRHESRGPCELLVMQVPSSAQFWNLTPCCRKITGRSVLVRVDADACQAWRERIGSAWQWSSALPDLLQLWRERGTGLISQHSVLDWAGDGLIGHPGAATSHPGTTLQPDEAAQLCSAMPAPHDCSLWLAFVQMDMATWRGHTKEALSGALWRSIWLTVVLVAGTGCFFSSRMMPCRPAWTCGRDW